MKLRSVALAMALLTGGAAIGATTQHLASASVSSGERPVLIPIEPCRLADTRPDPNTIGPRSTPLGPIDTLTIDTQQSGVPCSGVIPTDANALSLNITALGATQQSFLTIWANGDRPLAASLNPAPGQPPVPNAVTTELSTNQEFRIYNDAGTVNIVVDVNGYYVDHNHDDRYYTEAEVDALVDAAVDAAVDSAVDSAVAAVVDSRPKWISIDPFAVARRNSAFVSTGFGVNSGLNLPPSTSAAFEFGFTLPPDYTPNTVLTITMPFHIGQTGCNIAFRPNYTSISRPGAAFGTFGLSGGYSGAVPSTSHQVTEAVFSMGPSNIGLEPGDAVLVGVFRSSLNDTCKDLPSPQPIMITGIVVTYS